MIGTSVGIYKVVGSTPHTNIVHMGILFACSLVHIGRRLVPLLILEGKTQGM